MFRVVGLYVSVVENLGLCANSCDGGSAVSLSFVLTALLWFFCYL